MTFRYRWYPFVNSDLTRCCVQRLPKLAGARVLYVGCGVSASIAHAMAELGAELWCLDVDPELLRVFDEHPFAEYRPKVHTVLGDAHAMPFADGFFDVVFGKAIVHHLDIPRFMRELQRVCKPGAECLFCEPLAANPIIRLVRWLTPALRDEGEHPLTSADVNRVRSCCSSLHLDHRNLLSLLCIPLFWVGFHRAGQATFRFLERVDQVLFRLLPPLRPMAWNVIMAGKLLGAGAASAEGGGQPASCPGARNTGKSECRNACCP
jgi:SAM-dependent methyltransferase